MIAVVVFWVSNIKSSVFVSIYSLILLCFFGFGLWAEYNEKKMLRKRLDEQGVKFLTPTWFTNVRGLSNVCIYAISTILFMLSLTGIIERDSSYNQYTYSFNWGVMFLSLFFIMGLPFIINYIGGVLFKTSIEADKYAFIKLNNLTGKTEEN